MDMTRRRRAKAEKTGMMEAVSAPMMFLSGVFFPLDTLPDAVQVLAQCLPLTHAVALVRPLFLDQWPDAPWLHVGVLVAYGSVAWLIALHLTRKRFKQ